MSGLDGQMFGDLRPDASGMWSKQQLRSLLNTEKRFGDQDRSRRIACIEREIERRNKEAKLCDV
jgi:hypothetical protein